MAHVYRTKSENLADVLLKLTWSEMQAFAGEITALIEVYRENSEDFDIEDTSTLAALIVGWAEGEDDKYNARCEGEK